MAAGNGESWSHHESKTSRKAFAVQRDISGEAHAAVDVVDIALEDDRRVRAGFYSANLPRELPGGQPHTGLVDPGEANGQRKGDGASPYRDGMRALDELRNPDGLQDLDYLALPCADASLVEARRAAAAWPREMWPGLWAEQIASGETEGCIDVPREGLHAKPDETIVVFLAGPDEVDDELGPGLVLVK